MFDFRAAIDTILFGMPPLKARNQFGGDLSPFPPLATPMAMVTDVIKRH